MAVPPSTDIQYNSQLLNQLELLLDKLVGVLDGESQLVVVTSDGTTTTSSSTSLLSTDNIDKINLVITDTLEAIDQVVLSEQVVGAP